MTATGRSADGAWVAELTGMLDLAAWPKGMRVIVRKERPHPGAQLRLTDIDGHRFTCFATSTRGGQLADLELRHRRRARCEDRIRCAKDTGLRNLPLHGYAQNQIWCEIVALACELLAWMALEHGGTRPAGQRGNPYHCRKPGSGRSRGQRMDECGGSRQFIHQRPGAPGMTPCFHANNGGDGEPDGARPRLR